MCCASAGCRAASSLRDPEECDSDTCQPVHSGWGSGRSGWVSEIGRCSGILQQRRCLPRALRRRQEAASAAALLPFPSNVHALAQQGKTGRQQEAKARHEVIPQAGAPFSHRRRSVKGVRPSWAAIHHEVNANPVQTLAALATAIALLMTVVRGAAAALAGTSLQAAAGGG